MDREQAKEYIKTNVSCTEYLQAAPNRGSYCCPACKSGTHGNGSTGAVKFYEDTNTWYCHKCNAGGDVIDAYMQTTGADYNTALQELAARAGISIDNDRQNAPQSDVYKTNDKQPQNIEKSAQNDEQRPAADYTNYYRTCRQLIADPAAVSYLQARGISTATAERCGIGYDPAADPAAAPGATTDAGKRHPAPRIIAPCTKDFYIARATDPNTPGQFKAINPAGSHAQLFNAAAIYSNDVVFITEGLFDALSFIEAGAAAIALNSKGNNSILLQQIRQRPTQAAFIICPDNDGPEQAADTMKRANELNDALRAMDLQSIVYNVAGTYHDANDALRADRQAFEQNIAAAIKKLRSDDLTEFFDKIQTEAYKPYKTGLTFFDELLGGGIIQQSLLLLLAAPGTGKTTLAQQIAETMAANGKPVLFLNFEMSREQMLAKAISAELKRRGVNMSTTDVMQGYNWTDTQRRNVADVMNEYRAEIYPNMKYNPDGVSSEIDDLLQYLTKTGEKTEAAGQPAPAVVVDYLHLIRSGDGLDVQELIKKAVTGLKEYARKYNTFVIGIVAINRSAMKDGRITLESGRDSSNLEYTADYQISLNYTAIDRKDIAPDDVQGVADLQALKRRPMILRVLKNRFGQPGKYAHVLFDAEHNLFEKDDANHDNHDTQPQRQAPVKRI